nr:hypothetical protein [Tanacetum cinerariifolium]
MTRSSTKELFKHLENLKRVSRSKKRLFETLGLVESCLPEFDLFYDIKEWPKIDDKTQFKLKGQFLKELRENTFSGSEHEDTNDHIEKVLEIVDLFHIPEETLKIKFLNKYRPPARTTKKIKEINNFQQEPDESLFRAWEIFKELLMKCPQHYLTDMSEIKKVNDKIYAAQVRCELCKGPHYTKDCPLKEEWKTLEEAYYTQFGVPYQPRGQYIVAGPEFDQRNNGNSSYLDQRQTMEQSLTKFMAESAMRHKENSNIIKEIRASTDAAIKNQGALIKNLEIQIG